MKLDLSSLASVRAFVAEFKASKLGLDSLILNAGVMHIVSGAFVVCLFFSDAAYDVRGDDANAEAGIF